MIAHTEYPQGSVDWMLARSGIPTASEFDQLVTPLGEPRKGEMPKSYLAAKLAEWWQGGPLLGFNQFDVEQGQILENEAKPWYELQTGQDIQAVGFVTTDDGKVGCSPDGLLDNGGIEIKCPRAETHVAYLLEGTLPKAYIAQVQGSLWITGFQSWRFLCYRRRFPNLLLTVERDEKFQAALTDALGQFLERFEAGKKRLCDINGGPPTRSAPVSKPTSDSDEVIP